MSIADGTFKTFEADHYGFPLHTGNMYIEDDIVTVDFEMTTIAKDPFKVFARKEYINNPDRVNQANGSVYRRYNINLKTEEVTYSDTLSGGEEGVGFPKFNPTFAGKKSCFSYINELFFTAQKTSIVKIDHCKGTETRWIEPGVWVSEPYFVDDPTSEKEDAGFIMVSVFDDKLGKNRFLMIDAETMLATSDTELPMRIPMSLHQQWFPS